jgi:hypothetical protein
MHRLFTMNLLIALQILWLQRPPRRNPQVTPRRLSLATVGILRVAGDAFFMFTSTR